MTTTEEVTGLKQRRTFLKQLLTGSMATMALPLLAGSRIERAKQDLTFGGDPADERYWEMVKKQFTVPPNLIMMNAANLCPSPYFISDLISGSLKGLNKDVSFQYRAQFAEKRSRSLEMLAAFTGVTKPEIGIVRNASEGNNIVVNGLDLKAGDEVIIWEQNHQSNSSAWEQRAKRLGFTVKKIAVPAIPKSKEELTDAFAKAITSKTKVITFSHISNLSGIALPAKEICQLARTKKILTLVDGAQSLGMLDLNLSDIGCDFYTASTHKWLMGPFENGILYVRRENIERLWPTMISAGWKDTSITVDEKLCILGQRNETTPFALPETLDFHLSIGKKVIEDRVRALSGYLKKKLQESIPQVTFISPMPSELSGGIVIINIPGKQASDVYQKLYEKHGIAAAATGGVRLSPHIYTTMEDMDKVVSALTSLAA